MGTTTDDDNTDSEFSACVSRSSFIAFHVAFYDIIGANAICEKMFNVSEGVHEAPIWLPEVNKLLVSPLNQSFQLLIDLNSNPVCHLSVY
jgi:hypothetical protein